MKDFKNSIWWFSGGGMKIYWHAGVVTALYEMGLEPYAMGGTSAGALISAAVPRIGIHNFNEILFGLKKQSDIFNCNLWDKFMILIGKRNGQYDLDELDKLMKKHVVPHPPKFSSVAVYVNWNTTEVHYGHSNDLNYFTYVKASSSIPVVMKLIPDPLNKGQWLCDGGARAQLDVEYAKKAFTVKDTTRKIIAVGTNPFSLNGPTNKETNPSLIETLEQAVDILSHETYYRDIDDYMDDPQLKFILPDGVLNLKTTEVHPEKGKDIFEMGFNKAMEVFGQEDRF